MTTNNSKGFKKVSNNNQLAAAMGMLTRNGGNSVSDKTIHVEHNNVNIDNEIKADLINPEVTISGKDQLKFSISLPWGGEAKMEWNGSVSATASKDVIQELHKQDMENLEAMKSTIKGCIEYFLSRGMKFVTEELPQIKSSIDSLEARTLAEKYDELPDEWRRKYERYISFRKKYDFAKLDEIECNSNNEYEYNAMKKWSDAQYGLSLVGALLPVQIELCKKVGIDVIEEDSNNLFDEIK